MKIRFTRQWLIRFAGLAVAFAAAALAQHRFVERAIYRETDQDLVRSAAALSKEAAPTGTWDLKSLRQTFLNIPSWYVVTHDGLLLDVEDTIPGLFQNVRLISDSLLFSPTTIMSTVGEKWRLLGKRLDSGVAVVGISSLRDTKGIDDKLRATLVRIGTTLKQARATRSSAVDIDVDWAVVTSHGDLAAGVGGIPLLISAHDSPVPLDRAAWTTLNRRAGTYRLYSMPVRQANGSILGTIIAPSEISQRLRTLQTLDMLNITIATALFIATFGWAVLFVGQGWLIERRGISIEEALRVGESKSVEFKASYQYDVWSNKRKPELRLNVLRAIAGFLNSEGGTLFIGAEEDKLGGARIRGLREDLNLLGGNRDKLRLDLANLITSQIGHEFPRLISDRIENVGDAPYWVVEVRASRAPAFIKWNDHERFFVREGPKTNELGPKSALTYIKDRWG